MSGKKVYRAIGLMSGTSLDGVDAALIETDGYGYVEPLDFVTVPYDEQTRAVIRAEFGKSEYDEDLRWAESLVTAAHMNVLKDAGWEADVIGFHGQTVFHAPDEGLTLQVGDGAALAKGLGIDVVCDFRTADVQAGGQGAPLAPLYHKARLQSSDVPLPCAILNIGGVANVTWIDAGVEEILAFDTGPGNALMDDWVKMRLGEDYDVDGRLAAQGTPLEDILEHWLFHDYFRAEPPKSLDRDEWDIAEFGRLCGGMEEVSDADGAATLLEFTARTIIDSQSFMPYAPKAWYICGGGRRNKELMARLMRDLPVHMVEDLGWNGDAVEAECFGYLAVRSLLGEPISLPGTTGVPQSLSGGRLYKGG